MRRGYCTKSKQEWPDSGSTLENIFWNFYEINSSQDFLLYCKNVGVDGNSEESHASIILGDRSPKGALLFLDMLAE